MKRSLVLFFIISILFVFSWDNPTGSQPSLIEGSWSLAKITWYEANPLDTGTEHYSGSDIPEYLVITSQRITQYWDYNGYVNQHSNSYVIEDDALVIFHRNSAQKNKYPFDTKGDTLMVTDYWGTGYERYYFVPTNTEIPPFYWPDSTVVDNYNVGF